MTAYRFIAAKKTAGAQGAQGAQGHEDSVLASVPVRVLCRSLGVSPSGYYAWLERPASSRSVADTTLTATLQAIHATSRGTYGAPRVHAELTDPDGLYQVRCGRKRVARLMRLARIIGCHRRRARHTTIADPTAAPAEDLVKRAFAPAAIEAPDRLYVADITYVRTWEGWLYLAVVLDCFSRRVVGWAMADHLRAELCLDALEMAVERRQPGPALLHHSDRGVQYACEAYRAFLDRHGMTASMSRSGNCYDNAAMESFFGTLKTELVHHERYTTREQARSSIFEYVEVFYNRQRRHSAIGYVSPDTFEAAFN